MTTESGPTTRRVLAASFALGAYAVVAQSILVREFLVASFGNEMSWGITFFGWLLGLALGAWAGGRFCGGAKLSPTLILDFRFWILGKQPSRGDAPSSPSAGQNPKSRIQNNTRGTPAIAAALAALALVTPVCVFLIRISRGFFDVGPGEYLPLGSMLWLYPLLTLPISFIVGFAFPIASSLAGVACVAHPPSGEAASVADVAQPPSAGTTAEEAKTQPGGHIGPPLHEEGSIANVYVAEAFGALVGGALFSFVLVDRIPAFPLVGYAGAILLLAASFLAVASSTQNPKSKTQNLARLVTPALIFVLATVLLAPRIERASVERRWATFATGTTIVPPSPVDSRYQNITLARRGEEYSVFLDGLKSMAFPDPVEHTQDAHFVMCEAKNVRRVLLIGGGMEGPLAEMLKYPVERIDYVTLDPSLVDLVKPYLPPADRAALENRKVHVFYEDGIQFLIRHREEIHANSADEYDLIWLNVPEPTSLLMERYYSNFHLLERNLARQGLVVMRLTASSGYFDDEHRRYLASVVSGFHGWGIREYWDFHWTATWGEQTFILASTGDNAFTTDGSVLAKRYLERGIKSEHFDPAWFEGATEMLVPEKVAKIRAEIERGLEEGESSCRRDSAPYLRRTILDERMRTGGSFRLFETLTRMSLLEPFIAAALVAVFWFAAAKWLLKRSAVETAMLFSVGTTGFATIALSLVLLVAFQNVLGYVYAWVGIMVGVFMFGLFVGGLDMKTRLRRNPSLGIKRLARYDFLLPLVLFGMLAAYSIVTPLEAPEKGDPGCLPFAVGIFFVGFFGGLIFPLAAKIAIGEGKTTGRAAASITAADNIGACVGALLTGVALVPALGLAGVCVLLVLLKLLSAGVLFLASRARPRM